MLKLFLLFTTLSSFILAGTPVLKGVITDKETNKPVEKANVYFKNLDIGTFTNSLGEYYITGVESGETEIFISCVGYKTYSSKINLKSGENKLDFQITPGVISLGEVKVTSGRFVQTEREMISPAEIIDAKKIAMVTPNSISELAKTQPGVSIIRDGAWASTISIRGLSRNNIVTLVNGTRMETATSVSAKLSLVDVNDIERIEIIKGAASTLYGSGATGGIINIITAGNSFTENFMMNGKISSGYNSVNNMTSNYISLAASNSFLWFKASYTTRNAESTETPEGKLDNSQFRDNNISAQLGVKLFTRDEFLVKFEKFTAEDVGIPGGAPFPATAVAKYPETYRTHVSAEYKFRQLNDVLPALSLLAYYQDIQRNVELRPNANARVTPKALHTTYGAKLKSDWLLKDKLFSLGLDYWQRSYDGERKTENYAKNLVKIDKPVPNSTFSSFGIFADNKSKLLDDKLEIEVGARYDFINVTNDAISNPISITVNGNDKTNYDADASYASNDVTDKSWSASLGANYHINSFIDVTGNVARSFRSPTLEERYQYLDLGGMKYFGNPELNSELGTFLDFGLRLWHEKFTLKANIFGNSFTDLVVDSEEIKDSVFVKKNVGEARIYGYEIAGEYNFYSNMLVYANVAYTRGEDTGNDVNLDGIPPYNGMLGIKIPVKNYFTAELSGMFNSDQEMTGESEDRTAGYSVYNLSLSSGKFNYNRLGLQLSCGVDNIFDRAYRNHLSTYRGIQYIEPGRNLYLKLNVTY